MLQILARRFSHHLGRRCQFIVRHQPVKTAQRIAQICACLSGNRFEQRPAFGGVCRGGLASLNDRDLSRAKPLGSAHRRAEVLRTDAPVHTRRVVDGGQHVVKGSRHGRFQFGRHFRRLPYRANFALGARAVALSQQHARERKPAKRANRLRAEEAAHGGSVALLFPQPCLRTLAQQWDIRPVGIGSDEDGVAVKSGGAVGSQERPFDEFLRHWIADQCGEPCRVTKLALLH
jgi:hypothetical protein